VLSQQDQALNIVGRLENLAPGESIYSVRFVGDLGFISTYVQIDPLFAIDLSDPTNPRVAGQLEVAGYSDYLQMIDATHMIGIGRDVQPGANEPDGVQVSLYDVVDPNHPMLLSRYVMSGDWWLSSAAEHDPHALTYDAESHSLVLPVSENGHGSQMVFQVDTTNGALELKGEITDSTPAQAGLVNPWAYYTPLQRSVMIGDALYTISNNSVQVHSLDDLGTLVAQVSLPDPNSTPSPEIWEPIDISNNRSGGGASQPLIFVDAGLDPTSSAKDKSPASAESPSAAAVHGTAIDPFDPSFLGGVLVG
jgi:uncharacterized secreted protein with C-terminal beta-propeller domain